ncbi:cell division protein FtsL [Rhizomicrobium palustre]|jgi:cell division protein FtsL|uniref:Cell division protein FtsL n=1 Tax=Rhizomicrobium palustre TaxID=189966 RepID=A0A846MVE3_9PROT|nr:hypothetical protein [Rhizomicrobium palustre]NIK87508.1 cell division protein FtsL [Rhizomicrobium palustre]
MIRIISTLCVGLLGFSMIWSYDTFEKTRIAQQELRRTQRQIQDEQTQISVLEVQWQKAANPETIQKLAESSLGMQNSTTVQLASVTLLPHRSEALNGEEMQQASAQAPMNVPNPVVKISARSGM